MMLIRSGGKSSPRLSRSLFVAHSSPVVGWIASPTELRRPRANTRPPEPSRLNCTTAARIESVSSQMLQEEPTLTYILPSLPNTIVRVECPRPPGMVGTTTTLFVAPGSNRTTSVFSATYIVSPRNAIPKGPFSPETTVTAVSATPSWFASARRRISPAEGREAYTTPPGPSTR